MVMKTIHIDTLKSGWTGKYLASVMKHGQSAARNTEHSLAKMTPVLQVN